MPIFSLLPTGHVRRPAWSRGRGACAIPRTGGRVLRLAFCAASLGAEQTYTWKRSDDDLKYEKSNVARENLRTLACEGVKPSQNCTLRCTMGNQMRTSSRANRAAFCSLSYMAGRGACELPQPTTLVEGPAGSGQTSFRTWKHWRCRDDKRTGDDSNWHDPEQELSVEARRVSNVVGYTGGCRHARKLAVARPNAAPHRTTAPTYASTNAAGFLMPPWQDREGVRMIVSLNHRYIARNRPGT